MIDFTTSVFPIAPKHSAMPVFPRPVDLRSVRPITKVDASISGHQAGDAAVDSPSGGLHSMNLKCIDAADSLASTPLVSLLRSLYLQALLTNNQKCSKTGRSLPSGMHQQLDYCVRRLR